MEESADYVVYTTAANITPIYDLLHRKNTQYNIVITEFVVWSDCLMDRHRETREHNEDRNKSRNTRIAYMKTEECFRWWGEAVHSWPQVGCTWWQVLGQLGYMTRGLVEVFSSVVTHGVAQFRCWSRSRRCVGVVFLVQETKLCGRGLPSAGVEAVWAWSPSCRSLSCVRVVSLVQGEVSAIKSHTDTWISRNYYHLIIRYTEALCFTP